MARASPMRAPLEREKKPARRRGDWAEGAKIGQGVKGEGRIWQLKAKKKKKQYKQRTLPTSIAGRAATEASLCGEKKATMFSRTVVTRRSILESFPRFIAIAIAPILEPFTAISPPPPVSGLAPRFTFPGLREGSGGFPKYRHKNTAPPQAPICAGNDGGKENYKIKPPFLAKQATRRHSCPCSQAKEGGKLWRGPPPPLAPLFFLFWLEYLTQGLEFENAYPCSQARRAHRKVWWCGKTV